MLNLEKLTTENRQLQLAVNELKVLNDIATTISSIQPVEEIIDQIVVQCIKHLGVEEGAVSLLEHEAGGKEFHTMIRRQDSAIDKVPYKLDNHLTGWMIKHKSALMSNNIRKDERFNFLSDVSYLFHSLLCVPLMIKGTLIGYLVVFNKKNKEPFSSEDRRLLSIIASQSAQVIENARLYEEEKALISLKEEMRMAREIQLNLLPDQIPKISGYQISATNIPAKSVGGDYYDFLSLSRNRLGFCIGDITGKGMPAAMLMANLQATFRSQGLIYEDCSTCMQGTNKMLYRSTESTKFATFFYGILDVEKSTICFANGGHDAPLLFHEDENPQHLKATGLLLGVMAETDYSEQMISLEPNDILVLFTDGITEAMNQQGDLFGLDRLIEIVTLNRNRSAQKILDSILQDIRKHAKDASQSDDITVMIVKREAES